MKIKHLIGTGLIVAGANITPSTTLPSSCKSSSRASETTEISPSTKDTITKRTPTKVYHRFEEIPALSDREALLYSKDEYTYIINADKYTQTGEIELKRILKAELTSANVLSLVYRSEGETYIPKHNEDQIVKYKIDPTITSNNFIGPSQMDANATASFLKYLAARPDTREYVLSLFSGTPAAVEKKALELEKHLFTNTGTLKPIKDRQSIIHCADFKQLKLKYPFKTAYKKAVKNFNNDQKFLQALEDYNLVFYPLGRLGKPYQVTFTIALIAHLRDKQDNIDATRVPTFVIAAAISSLNWKGNGSAALTGARNLQGKLNFKNLNSSKKLLITTVKQWVSGKSRSAGVQEIAQLNIITPEIIRQYQALELSGAENLAQAYNEAVNNAEKQLRLPQLLADSCQKHSTEDLKGYKPMNVLNTKQNGR